ncbi:ADP-ribosylglycohydrolase family protein [Methylorubrum sp. POS3]|uniref:ADP-ribosylglycohydrolase family protein n=1 Tax=Methylorubrum sp. POS3 TaxID=2998492 RepID=UPI00372B32DC
MLSPLHDRAHGTLLGLAIGDALGATLEFEERDELPHHSEMLGGGPFDLKPGQWTDDTSMALALAESLIAHPELDAADLMRRFVAWAEDGAYSCTGTCFDIGITTRMALRHFERTGDPFAGSEDKDSAGNGSLMRIAPVALWALDDAALAAHIAREQSRTTHGAAEAIESCELFVQILREAIQGAGKEALRPRAWAGTPKVQAIAAGAWRGKPRSKIRSTGYVIDTLEAALWCTEQAGNFEDALVLAVNLAGDADTVGAVTGQIAGAVFGASEIPERWLAPLAWRDKLVALAAQLTHRPTFSA